MPRVNKFAGYTNGPARERPPEFDAHTVYGVEDPGVWDVNPDGLKELIFEKLRNRGNVVDNRLNGLYDELQGYLQELHNRCGQERANAINNRIKVIFRELGDF